MVNEAQRQEQWPKVIAPKRPGTAKRVIFTVAAIAVLLVILIGLIFSGAITWKTVWEYFFSAPVLSGLGVTIELTLISMVIGIALGIALALMVQSRTAAVRFAAQAYIWLFRGTPVLVQLIIWFNLALVVPKIGSISTNQLITPFFAAILGLGLNEGAYMSEIIRAGVQSVDIGQSEAGYASGMTRSQVTRKIVLPQALRIIIPPTGNQIVGMLKTTSLVSVIAANDLLTQVQHIYAQNFKIIELLVVASIWYLILTTIATFLQFLVENHLRKHRGITFSRKQRDSYSKENEIASVEIKPVSA